MTLAPAAAQSPDAYRPSRAFAAAGVTLILLSVIYGATHHAEKSPEPRFVQTAPTAVVVDILPQEAAAQPGLGAFVVGGAL